VVVEQAGEGGRRVFVARLAVRAGADQVVQRVPAGGDLLRQMAAAQVAQQRSGGGQVAAGQRRAGVRVEILAG
jgi:hypothetical protein